MGKSNRIRTQRAERVVAAPQVKKEKKGVPSWLYPVIAIVILVGAVIGVAATLISSSGLILRSQAAVKSENYSISGMTFQYMFNEKYATFVSENETYLSLYGLDSTVDLKDQKYTLDDSGDNKFDTWYDYFVESTATQAREILIYCEEADKRGITLDDADIASVDSTLSQLELYAMLYGYSDLDQFLSLQYTEGMKAKDARQYLELYTLATKCASVVGEDLMNAITPARVIEKYESDSQTYNVVDYDVFTTKVSYSTIQKELYPDATELDTEQAAAVLAAYQERVLEAVELQKKYAALTSVEEFEAMLLEEAAKDAFDTSYTSEALADDDKFSEEDLRTVKASLIANALEDVENKLSAPSKDTADEDGKFTVYGFEVSENTAKAIDNVKQDVFDAIKSKKESSVYTGIAYNASSEIIKWAFDTDEANAVKLSETGDTPDAEGKVINKNGYFEASVYMLKTPEYRDETLSKNMSYMTFTTEEAAKNAIELLGGFETLTAEDFLSIATTVSASDYGSYEDYLEGSSTYTELDKWLFDENTKAGSITETPLILSESETSTLYGVFLYEEDSYPVWHLAVKSAIYSEDADAKYAELLETYAVTVNDKVTNKVD